MLGEVSVYHPRNPEISPFWKLMIDHYHSFEQHYEERFEKHYGFLRPVIGEVVREYLRCVDPIPHRQYIFSIPIMLRVYFKYERGLLTKLCHGTYESLLVFLHNVIGLTYGALEL